MSIEKDDLIKAIEAIVPVDVTVRMFVPPYLLCGDCCEPKPGDYYIRLYNASHFADTFINLLDYKGSPEEVAKRITEPMVAALERLKGGEAV